MGGTALVLGNASCRAGGENCTEGGASAATLAGYQVRGEWLEEHGNLISALVLIAIGIVLFLKVV